MVTVGNPAMHILTMVGGLPGVEALATKMMKKEMEKLDMPPVDEFLEILSASGVKLWECKLALDMFHIKEEDLVEDFDGVLTIGDYYYQADQEGTQILYIIYVVKPGEDSLGFFNV